MRKWRACIKKSNNVSVRLNLVRLLEGAQKRHPTVKTSGEALRAEDVEAPALNDDELGVKVGLSQSQVKKIFSEVEFGSGGVSGG